MGRGGGGVNEGGVNHVPIAGEERIGAGRGEWEFHISFSGWKSSLLRERGMKARGLVGLFSEALSPTEGNFSFLWRPFGGEEKRCGGKGGL